MGENLFPGGLIAEVDARTTDRGNEWLFTIGLKTYQPSLPTLGGTQPQRSTWSTPTQEGVQASLPSTKLPWSVAEEEDEDDLRKR